LEGSLRETNNNPFSSRKKARGKPAGGEGGGNRCGKEKRGALKKLLGEMILKESWEKSCIVTQKQSSDYLATGPAEGVRPGQSSMPKRGPF